jgi:hypothetical protein
MEIFTYIGMFAVAVGAIGIASVLYSLVRALFLAHDFIMWQYAMSKQSNPSLKFEFRLYFKGIRKNWIDMIGYAPDDFTCRIGSSEWRGWRTWR